jgi:hypothetical protein
MLRINEDEEGVESSLCNLADISSYKEQSGGRHPFEFIVVVARILLHSNAIKPQ